MNPRSDRALVTDEVISALTRIGKDPNDNLIGAEIGVLQGRLSIQLLERLPKLFLHMIDQWDAGWSLDWVGTERYLSKEKWVKMKLDAENRTQDHSLRRKIIQATSIQAAKPIENGSLDFVFIDGGHCYEDTLLDIQTWAEKVKRDGLIGGHDIDHPRTEQCGWGVRRAVEHYLSTLEDPPELFLGASVTTTWFFGVG